MRITSIVAACFVAAGVVGATLAAQDTKSVWDGVYTQEQANRGAALYRQQCLSCHGEDGVGGEMASPLAGGEFTTNWNGQTVGDLFERTRVSMPPEGSGKLTSKENADLVAYMLSLNRFPTGQSELPTQPMLLKLIRIDAQKP